MKFKTNTGDFYQSLISKPKISNVIISSQMNNDIEDFSLEQM